MAQRRCFGNDATFSCADAAIGNAYGKLRRGSGRRADRPVASHEKSRCTATSGRGKFDGTKSVLVPALLEASTICSVWNRSQGQILPPKVQPWEFDSRLAVETRTGSLAGARSRRPYTAQNLSQICPAEFGSREFIAPVSEIAARYFLSLPAIQVSPPYRVLAQRRHLRYLHVGSRPAWPTRRSNDPVAVGSPSCGTSDLAVLLRIGAIARKLLLRWHHCGSRRNRWSVR